jgi:N-acetylmuramoyl-L-alanine amidase
VQSANLKHILIESGTVKKAFLLLLLFPVFIFSTGSIPKIKPSSAKVKTVVIDAGHGGKDPGCHGELYKEKDIALAVSLKLGKFIEENFKDVKVIYTRKTDVFVELNERAEIANRNGADLFICVHCNSACVYDKRTRKETCNEGAHGAETYVMGVNKNAGNLAVAKRENKSILLEDNYKKAYGGFDPNSDEANILFAMYQSVYLAQSSNLAAKIQDCYRLKAGRNDKGLQQAGFLVLWKTAMPSLLTEIGYLTNRKEEKFLGSEKGASVIASSIFRAFRMYKNELEGTSEKYNDDFEKVVQYSQEKDSVVVPEVKTPVKSPEKEEKKQSTELKHKDVGPAGIIEEKKKKTIVTAPVKEERPVGQDPAGVPGNEIGKGLNGTLAVSAGTEAELNPSEAGQKKDTAGHAPAVSVKVTPPVKKDKAPAEPTKPAEEQVYKVLFYASDKKLNPDDKKFEGLSKVGSFEEGGRIKYTSGEFQKKADAEKHQAEVRKLGFQDAFVACFRNGARVK